MQVFKCAMRIIRGNIIFPIVYIIGLSFMGIFMAQSFDFGGIEQTLDQKNAQYAIVDRDKSALSKGIAEFLDQHGVPVKVEDTRRAFQDAVAKGQVDYLLIIPEGYERDFLSDVKAGEALPQMEVVFSYYSSTGSLIDEAVSSYLGLVRTLVLEKSDAPMKNVLAGALELTQNRADIKVFEAAPAVSEADRFVFYLQWSTYTLFAGIVVCIGMLISTMNRADVRRRNLSSPLSYMSYNTQLALSCAIFALIACVWTYALGLTVFSEAAAAISLEGLLLGFLSVFAYSVMALAFGFMLGQFGASGIMCNAIGNILGMVISFLGGAWIALDMLSPEILALAHWLPGFWYTDACRLSAHLEGATSIGAVFTDIGVLALFAIAFLSVGFVAAKRKLQTAEAGGNRAAEVVQ